MAQANKRGRNEPEPPKIVIVKKIIADSHGGHHGGAWKVAYADFVTAMMAFFLLLWLLGATTEKQRKGIADYFTPTLVELREQSAGANGVLGGKSIVNDEEHYSFRASQSGSKSITVPKDATGGAKEGAMAIRTRDRVRFRTLTSAIQKKIAATPALKRLAQHIRFTETTEGLRIDIVDQADFSMFELGTSVLVPQAQALVEKVAQSIADVPNGVIVRGHTDALPYAAGRTVNNWTLSAARAEATRATLATNGVAADRIERIEGVADREPYTPENVDDPRNRRISITLAWTKGGADPTMDAAATAAVHGTDAPPPR